MALDPAAVAVANAQLWARHPALAGRALTSSPADAAYRAEWQALYNQALAAKVPPPPVVPVSAPPPLGAVVAACPLVTKKSVSTCSDLAKEVQEGDIVLRSTVGEDSDLIRGVADCPYSHAGIVARNSSGDLVVVDAYPGRSSGSNENKEAVKTEAVSDFFCSPSHKAYGGLVSRPKDCAKAKKAAEWAMDQTKDPDYEFVLNSPWDRDPKQLYCSDLVYQSFKSAGQDIVPVKRDMLSAANKSKTLDALRTYIRKNYGIASKEYLATFAPDSFFESIVRKQFGGSEYITPCQVAMNAETDVAAEWK